MIIDKKKKYIQVSENNLIRRLARVKRVKRRRMKYLREEIRTGVCIVGKIIKSRMKEAGNMFRIKEDKLLLVETNEQGGTRKLQLRWEDCLKRDLIETDEEEMWRQKASNMVRWKNIMTVAIGCVK